jgi:hypothetical protein
MQHHAPGDWPVILSFGEVQRYLGDSAAQLRGR